MPSGYEVHVDWNGDGDFSDPGEDVSARVFDRGTPLTIRYGRDQARAFAPLAGGRAQFELDNSSRDYSPENTSSPLAGTVLPGREVRIRKTHLGTVYGLLRGNTDDYEVLPDPEQRSVQITCLDGLARLKEVRVTTDLHHGVRTGQAVGLLLDAIGWPAAARDLDVGGSTLPWWWLQDTDAHTALQTILDCEGPGSLATIDIDNRFVFRDRHHRIVRATSTTVQATLRSGGAEPCYSDLVYDHGWKEIINSVSFAIPVRQPAGALSAVWSMQGQTTIADGQTASLTAQASEPFTGAIAPVAGTDFELVSGAVQTSLSRTSGQATTVFIKAVGGPATFADVRVRAYPLVTSTATVLAEDSTSISRYGRRSWPSGREPALASLNDAIAIADIILAHRAQRLPTVTVTLRGGITERLTQQLARNLSDRVRIIDAGTGLDADFWLETIQHTVSQDHVTQFGCEKIPTSAANPFTFDKVGAGFDQGTFAALGRDNPSTVWIWDHPTQGVFDIGVFAN